MSEVKGAKEMIGCTQSNEIPLALLQGRPTPILLHSEGISRRVIGLPYFKSMFALIHTGKRISASRFEKAFLLF
jgi:hypothetical protein